jgi:hypothetical protein
MSLDGGDHVWSKNGHARQIISTGPRSQAYNTTLTRREPSISEPMTIGMVRQPAEACLTLAERLGSHGVATPPISGIN